MVDIVISGESEITLKEIIMNIDTYNNIKNITLEQTDIKKNWHMVNSYDVVVLTSYINNEIILTNHLKDFSKAFLFTGSSDNPVKKAILIQKFKKNSLTKDILFETDVDPMV